MNTIIKIIGSIGFAILMYAIPVLTACSLCLKWGFYICYLLIFFSLIQIAILTVCIFFKIEDDEL